MAIIGIFTFSQIIFMFYLVFYSVGKIGEINVPSIITGIIFSYPFLAAILFILSALFIVKGKKWAWFAAIVLLLKEVVVGIQASFLVFPDFLNQLSRFSEILPAQVTFFFITSLISSVIIYIFVIISLIFLFQERKNFWLIAS